MTVAYAGVQLYKEKHGFHYVLDFQVPLQGNFISMILNYLDQRFSTWGTRAGCRGYAKFQIN